MNPWAGWYVFADFERGAGWIDVAGPDVAERAHRPRRARRAISRGFFDLRRYNRVSPSAQLNLRLVLGGWLSGDPLPLQRRLSIDGPGTVPGFDFRSTEGLGRRARAARARAPPGRPAQCERVALAQLEYRERPAHLGLARTRSGAPHADPARRRVGVLRRRRPRMAGERAGQPAQHRPPRRAGALVVSHGHRRRARLRSASASTWRRRCRRRTSR